MAHAYDRARELLRSKRDLVDRLSARLLHAEQLVRKLFLFIYYFEYEIINNLCRFLLICKRFLDRDRLRREDFILK